MSSGGNERAPALPKPDEEITKVGVQVVASPIEKLVRDGKVVAWRVRRRVAD